MREIEFRAWEKNLKEIIPIHSINFEAKMVNRESAWRLFDEVELMQYTGLIDIQGKPIFEKDVIQDDEGFRWNVFYKHGSFYAECTDLMAEQLLSSVNLFGKVIGNIYENPELVKGHNDGLLKCYESGTL
jgi:hypothetical protein